MVIVINLILYFETSNQQRYILHLNHPI